MPSSRGRERQRAEQAALGVARRAGLLVDVQRRLVVGHQHALLAPGLAACAAATA